MKQCIKCEQLIDDDSIFCPFCGMQQPALPEEVAPQIPINNPTNGHQPQFSPLASIPAYSQQPQQAAPTYGQQAPQSEMMYNPQGQPNAPVYGQQPQQAAPTYSQQVPQGAMIYNQQSQQAAPAYGQQGAMMYNQPPQQVAPTYSQQVPQGAMMYNQQPQQATPMYGQQPQPYGQPMYNQQAPQPAQPSAPANGGGFFSKIPKPLLIVVPAVLVILIIAVAIFSNLRGAGSTEKAVENFYNSLATGNSKKMVSSMMPKELEKAADKAMKSGEFGNSYDSFAEALDLMFDDYLKDGFKIDRVRITEKQKLERDEVKEFSKDFTHGFDVDVKISEVYMIKTTFRHQDSKDGDWEEDDMKLMIYKAGNRWYAMPSNMF